MAVANVNGAIIFITPHFRAGGSNNEACWVKYLCEINSCDKNVMRDCGWGKDKERMGGGG